MMNNIIKYIIFFNGIYDILCALFFINIHLSIYKNKKDINNRFLAYWIFTYGYIRLFILFDNKYINFIIFLSYFIEAFIYFIEFYYFNSTFYYKSLWIIISSLFIALSIYIK